MNNYSSTVVNNFVSNDVEDIELYPSHFFNSCHTNQPVFEYIKSLVDLLTDDIIILNSILTSELENIPDENSKSIINYNKINDARYINKYLEAINQKLPRGGIFVGCVETSNNRLIRIKKKYPLIFAYPFYAITFILKRVFPKWGPTKKIYFFLTKGKNRYISIAEILGRLFSCGFKIVDHNNIENKTYFVVQKINEPVFDINPTYGLLIKLKRKGKKGKEINVYKIRTMHPYAEYLQEYVYNNNNLKPGGKLNNDFRLTFYGKVFRKYWLDELPMFINFFKGELKLVGVRPLSQHYFSLYRNSLKELRSKHKPGLIPPFYADLPKTLDEVMDSEERYLKSYEKKPFLTDLKYLFLVFKNICFHNSRSA